jgi:hypothetical protein
MSKSRTRSFLAERSFGKGRLDQLRGFARLELEDDAAVERGLELILEAGEDLVQLGRAPGGGGLVDAVLDCSADGIPRQVGVGAFCVAGYWSAHFHVDEGLAALRGLRQDRTPCAGVAFRRLAITRVAGSPLFGP